MYARTVPFKHPSLYKTQRQKANLEMQLHGASPNLQNDELMSFTENQHQIKLVELFDEIMERLAQFSFNEAIETPLKTFFEAESVICWIPSNNENFFSATLLQTVSSEFLDEVSEIRIPTKIRSIDGSSKYSEIGLKKGQQVIVFPLSANRSICAVIVIVRSSSFHFFSEEDLFNATFIASEFSFYTNSLNSTYSSLKNAGVISTVDSKNGCFKWISTFLLSYFHAKVFDLWIYCLKSKYYFKFDNIDSFTSLGKSISGIIAYSLLTNLSSCERHAKNHPNFNKKYDSLDEEPIIVVLTEFDEKRWAICLRGRDYQFNGVELKELELLAPFIARSFAFSFNFSSKPSQPPSSTAKLLQCLDLFALLLQLQKEDVQFVIENKIPSILECKVAIFLPSVDNFFVYNNEKIPSEKFKSFGGSDYSFISIAKISSSCEVLVKFPNGKLIGILLALNKTSGNDFSSDDEELMMFFALFISICFNNKEKKSQLMSQIPAIGSILSSTPPIFLENLVSKLKLKRASIFAFDHENLKFNLFLSSGEVSVVDVELSQKVFDEKKPLFVELPNKCVACVPIPELGTLEIEAETLNESILDFLSTALGHLNIQQLQKEIKEENDRASSLWANSVTEMVNVNEPMRFVDNLSVVYNGFTSLKVFEAFPIQKQSFFSFLHQVGTHHDDEWNVVFANTQFLISILPGIELQPFETLALLLVSLCQNSSTQKFKLSIHNPKEKVVLIHQPLLQLTQLKVLFKVIKDTKVFDGVDVTNVLELVHQLSVSLDLTKIQKWISDVTEIGDNKTFLLQALVKAVDFSIVLRNDSLSNRISSIQRMIPKSGKNVGANADNEGEDSEINLFSVANSVILPVFKLLASKIKSFEPYLNQCSKRLAESVQDE